MKNLFLLCGLLSSSVFAAECDTSLKQLQDGMFIYSDFTSDTKYTTHCINAPYTGALTIGVYQSQTPVDIVVRRNSTIVGRNKINNQEVRQFTVEMVAGERYTIKTTTENKVAGHTTLMIQKGTEITPEAFKNFALFRFAPNSAEPVLNYQSFDPTLKPITLKSGEVTSYAMMSSQSFPKAGVVFEGVDPEDVVVTVVDLKTGEFIPVTRVGKAFAFQIDEDRAILMGVSHISSTPLTFKVIPKPNVY